MVKDIPLEAGSWEAEHVADLQNELQRLNDAAHQEQFQRGAAAEAGLVGRAAELQDELSSLGDAAAEEGYGGSAQVDSLRSEGHDSMDGDMSLMDGEAERAAKQQAAEEGKARKGARKGALADSRAKKLDKAKGQAAAKQAAASAQEASEKRKAAPKKRPEEDAGDEDYDDWP